MTVANKQNHSPINKFVLVLASFIIVTSTIVVTLITFSSDRKNKLKEIPTVSNAKNLQNTNGRSTINPYDPINKPIPDFSKEKVKSRTTFDTSTWKTYRNDEVGFSFKYPTELGKFGEPNSRGDGKLRASTYQSASSNYREEITSNTFTLEFKGVDFIVSGNSSNFSPGRGTSIRYDYSGGRLEYYFKCKPNALAFCSSIGDIADFVYGPPCGIDGVSYTRGHLINLPNGKVNGLVFSGKFIKEDSNLINMDGCNKEKRDTINNAIVSRKLDSESMRLFDLYEKIFETISIDVK